MDKGVVCACGCSLCAWSTWVWSMWVWSMSVYVVYVQFMWSVCSVMRHTCVVEGVVCTLEVGVVCSFEVGVVCTLGMQECGMCGWI